MTKKKKSMIKFIPAIGIVLFPYAIAFVLFCIFSGFLMESVFQSNVFLCVFALIALWIAALISAISICAVSLAKKWDFIELCKINMIIKIILIPAYVVFFLLGLACMITIFTIAISILLIIFDVMSIILSGIFGISAVKRSYDSKAISTQEMIIYGFLQFVFCADVISSIILFRKTKKLQVNCSNN